MTPEEFEKKLFRDTKEYGDKYVEHLLEQYKLYIASAEKISDRRQTTNSFFLGLNTAVLGMLGWINSRPGTGGSFVFLAASVAAIVICIFWFEMMRSYRNLNTAKFQVIHAIERRLPLSMYDVEWDIVQRGVVRKKYWPFSHIEMKVPGVFILIYAAIIVVEGIRLAMSAHAVVRMLSCF
jgi:hypothetical protein